MAPCGWAARGGGCIGTTRTARGADPWYGQPVVREVEWVRPLGEGVRKRHCHATTHGQVVGFTVQLEILFAGRWQPIVRYDAAHGFAHRDVYDTPTRKRKEALALDFSDALTVADRDVDRNWRQYMETFLRRNQ